MSGHDSPESPTPASPKLLVLPYQVGPDLPVRRPAWVYSIAIVYGLLLISFLTLPIWGDWVFGLDDAMAPIAIAVTGLLVAGLSLMIVPVRVMRRRPVTRRTVIIPIIGSGALFAFLFFGGAIAYAEFADAKGDPEYAILLAAIAVWIGWSIIFALIALPESMSGVGLKLHRWLIAGSVLELLVAVPAHIVVRRRTDCCAGIATGFGICVGVAVMLMALGPSVYLLYYRRVKRITPGKMSSKI